MVMLEPVTKRALSRARYETRPAISSGWATRLSGLRSASVSIAPAVMSVWVGPGLLTICPSDTLKFVGVFVGIFFLAIKRKPHSSDLRLVAIPLDLRGVVVVVVVANVQPIQQRRDGQAGE